jgi:hypothetical protein
MGILRNPGILFFTKKLLNRLYSVWLIKSSSGFIICLYIPIFAAPNLFFGRFVSYR